MRYINWINDACTYCCGGSISLIVTSAIRWYNNLKFWYCTWWGQRNGRKAPTSSYSLITSFCLWFPERFRDWISLYAHHIKNFSNMLDHVINLMIIFIGLRGINVSRHGHWYSHGLTFKETRPCLLYKWYSWMIEMSLSSVNVYSYLFQRQTSDVKQCSASFPCLNYSKFDLVLRTT